MRILVLVAVTLLVGCGVDGPPQAPGPGVATGTGVTLSGDVSAGIVIAP